LWYEEHPLAILRHQAKQLFAPHLAALRAEMPNVFPNCYPAFPGTYSKTHMERPKQKGAHFTVVPAFASSSAVWAQCPIQLYVRSTPNTHKAFGFEECFQTTGMWQMKTHNNQLQQLLNLTTPAILSVNTVHNDLGAQIIQHIVNRNTVQLANFAINSSTLFYTRIARTQYDIFLDIDTVQLAKQYILDLDELARTLDHIDQGTGVAYACLFPALWHLNFISLHNSRNLGTSKLLLSRHVSTSLSQNIAKQAIRAILTHFYMANIDFDVVFALDHTQFRVFEYSHLMSLHGMLLFIQRWQTIGDNHILHVSSYHVNNNDLAGISSRPFTTRIDPVYFPSLEINPTRVGNCLPNMELISDVSNTLFEFKTCSVCKNGEYFDPDDRKCTVCTGIPGNFLQTDSDFAVACSYTTDHQIQDCHEMDSVICEALRIMTP
jgi:hypothetical protein